MLQAIKIGEGNKHKEMCKNSNIVIILKCLSFTSKLEILISTVGENFDIELLSIQGPGPDWTECKKGRKYGAILFSAILFSAILFSAILFSSFGAILFPSFKM